ncbi:MAG TPA: hypothetical protein VH302_02930 [Bryobacteraceae bacterium]|jgi:hypothetical protein|nr:hypothetical protein [Bryobacteraceae bacterium]
MHVRRATHVWNNVRVRAHALVFLVLSICPALLAQSQSSTHSPRLLLTPQRLRRLKRDRERQTVRWVNFEKRVQTVADSPERGFELALYYAVTGDQKAGSEAVEWAHAHPCEPRQLALVLDWVPEELPANYGFSATCHTEPSARASRDAVFLQIVTGADPEELIERSGKELLSRLQSGAWQNPAELYAAVEYLYAVRSFAHVDLRQNAPQFFSALPAELLLSMKPEQVEHPDGYIHIAALALVGLDPNLEGSQFLQGWAMEDKQMISEGEGVAYEFLWADPYLPGVGYENLDPWSYREDGTLFARADWNTNSCWIHISPSATHDENCVSGWQQKTMQFGNLTLVPSTGRCLQIPARKNVETVIVSRFQPGQPVYFVMNNAPSSHVADASGMWKAPANAEGRVCISLDTLKVPPAQKSKPSRE